MTSICEIYSPNHLPIWLSAKSPKGKIRGMSTKSCGAIKSLSISGESSLTKAAQQLHITQPTLSRQIAQLEEELGVDLFVRSNHNIILTEDGMILKRRAQEILSLADKTKRDFLHKDENLEGVISIGSGEFLSTRCLTDCIAQLK